MTLAHRRLRSGATGLSCLLSAGCASPTEAPLPLGTVLASIDGVAFTARRQVYATHARGVLAIAALDDDGRTIHLTMKSPYRTAIVAVGAGEQNSASTGYKVQQWSSNLVGGMGEITVTAFDVEHAEGIFAYTAVAVPGTPARGDRRVTGRFNVPFAIVE